MGTKKGPLFYAGHDIFTRIKFQREVKVKQRNSELRRSLSHFLCVCFSVSETLEFCWPWLHAMSASKLVILSIFLALILTHVRAQVPRNEDGMVLTRKKKDEKVQSNRSPGSDDSSGLKIEQLESKIQNLGQFLYSLFSVFSTFFRFFLEISFVVFGCGDDRGRE